MDSPEGIEELMNRIKAGEHPLDAAEELERGGPFSRKQSRRVEAHERGMSSELAVQETIASLVGVSEVTRMEANKSADRGGVGGKDLVVHFNIESPFYELFSVGLQVKSSRAEGRKFRQMLSRNVPGFRREDVAAWMLQNKLIILIGIEPQEKIAEDFIQKTQEVYNYHFPSED